MTASRKKNRRRVRQIIEVLECMGSANPRHLLTKLAGGDESALTSQLAKEAIDWLKPW